MRQIYLPIFFAFLVHASGSLIGQTKFVDSLPLTSSPRLLTDNTFQISSSSIFGVYAPLQCLAGSYCAGRSGSVVGTASCPEGSYCPSGSVAPSVAPEGSFVSGQGSVRAYSCSSSTFAPFPGLPFCLPCPPGFSCADQGTTVPSICAAGTYRESIGSASIAGTTSNVNVLALNSISCQSCPEGTFQFIRGVPTLLDCEPCPNGRICLSKTGNITESYPCSEGYVCGEGVSLGDSNDNVCPNGLVCSKGTSPLTVYSNLCPSAFVCQTGTTYADQYRLRCPVGFYCPAASPWFDVMGFTLLPGTGYLSRGQFYVLQIAGGYCLRQRMLDLTAQADQLNESLINAGKLPLTNDQRSIIIAGWGSNVTNCIESQLSQIPNLNQNNQAISQIVTQYIDWHAENMFVLLADKRLDQYSNKCDNTQFLRPSTDGNTTTTWDCLCSAPDNAIAMCLTNTTLVSYVGAPFQFSAPGDGIDVDSVCEFWPDCLDWARIYDVSDSTSVSLQHRPFGHPPEAAVGAWDDFDSIFESFVNYIEDALTRDFLLFAENDQVTVTQCPFGTISGSDGLTDITLCQKRLLVPLVSDPDELITYRVNPINPSLSNVNSDIGYPRSSEEDLRRVFNLPARSFATISLDARDLPREIEYGRDWRIQVFVNNTLDPDANEPQVCYDILNNFLEYQFNLALAGTVSDFPGSERAQQMSTYGCSVMVNPLAFEAFQYATVDPQVCPSTTSAECYFLSLSTTPDMAACNPLQTPVNVHELYLHSLVDVQFRIEIQILNGMILPDRFKFIESVFVTVEQPSRAVLGTNKAFVIEYSEGVANTVYYPYNLVILPATQAGVDYYGTTPSGNVTSFSTGESLPATSQAGVITKAFLSWLPTLAGGTTPIPLTNCMVHVDDWSEFLVHSNTYFALTPRTSVFQTHLPFFSNCRGYGQAIPLWHVLETYGGTGSSSVDSTISNKCTNVFTNATLAVSELSVGGSSIGDACVGFEIECLMDEVPNHKQSLPRWFESPTGIKLFAISATAFSSDEYGTISGGISGSNPTSGQSTSIGKMIPVILRQGAKSDGTWLQSVDLVIRYWQMTTTEKQITTADVYFADFATLSDAQTTGDLPWTYTLRISWSPMSYIEIFNAYAFSIWVYFGLVCVTGLFSLAITTGNWVFHFAVSESRSIAVKLTDKRYWTLMFPAILKGVTLSLFPAIGVMLALIMIIIGETSLFSFTLITCDPNDPLGCQTSIFDFLPSSWSGESLNNPNSYQTRRNGRAGTVLILVGTYLVLHSIRAFIPNLVSHYYDEDNDSNGSEDDSSEDEYADEKGRSWPPDQQTFAPLVWKRSTWFFLIGGNCILLTLILEFSYSSWFTSNWWSYIILFYFVQKFISWVVIKTMREELLKVPVIAVFQTVMQITTLGSPDYSSFIITMLVTQLIFIIDRLYVMPNETMIARDIIGKKWKNIRDMLKTVIRGGKMTTGGSGGGSDKNNPTDTSAQAYFNPTIGNDAGIVSLSSDGNGVRANGDNDGTANVSGDPVSGDANLALIQQLGANAAERDSGDKMILFLSSYTSNALAALLTPITIILMYLFYNPTQSLNYYNVPADVVQYYYGFQAAMLFFKYVSDLIAMNTAEIYHEWKILDYLEYCLYRFMSRPNRWKGIGEDCDELMTPELRSLDLYCFSSQYYFSCFLNAIGAIMMIVGMQIVINNAWNVFDDQATMFIIILGLLLLGGCRFALTTAADYLKIWYDRQHKVDLGGEEEADEKQGGQKDGGSDSESEEDPSSKTAVPESSTVTHLFAQGKSGNIVKAPLGSSLYNWPEPSAGDKVGWDRYRSAYLRENQLWLQAHMDTLIDGPTIVEYRKKLMDSIAKVLHESNILDLTAKKKVAVVPLPGLQLNAAPPHEIASTKVSKDKLIHAGTSVEAAAIILLNRARFIKFISEHVQSMPLVQSSDPYTCFSCGTIDPASGLETSPEYPVSMAASEFRVQRNFLLTWNAPMWEHFYSEFTPACTLCEPCRKYYHDKDLPVGFRALSQNAIRPNGTAPPETSELLHEWAQWANGLVLDHGAGTLLTDWSHSANELVQGMRDQQPPPTSN